MATRAVFFIVTCIFLINTKVSSKSEEGYAFAPSPIPTSVVKAPSPTPSILWAPRASPPAKPPIMNPDCIPHCVVRCKTHSKKLKCLSICVNCCEKCKCVPRGQYSPIKYKCRKCYMDMMIPAGRPKCPN